MPDATEVIAGECTVEFEDEAEREQRGHVVVVVKPDDTVLVHDAEGYQPVAWLTRPEAAVVERSPPRVTARDGDQRLRVTVHDAAGEATFPATPAGQPVGDCRCGGVLVRASGQVTCNDCDEAHSIPRDAAVLDERCDCGRPRFRVERGAPFEVCLDRDCESLDAAVVERFDREWDCPECGGDLRVLRRGGLILGCECYPACEESCSLPAGVVAGECDCGLPVFEADGDRRCLADCDRSG